MYALLVGFGYDENIFDHRETKSCGNHIDHGINRLIKFATMENYNGKRQEFDEFFHECGPQEKLRRFGGLKKRVARFY